VKSVRKGEREKHIKTCRKRENETDRKKEREVAIAKGLQKSCMRAIGSRYVLCFQETHKTENGSF
jgi:hypothetical protein